MQIDPSLRKNVTMTYYAGGHMMYIDRAAHRKLREDAIAFLRGAM
jgi:carboxypeptidase C (cathepsin A)